MLDNEKKYWYKSEERTNLSCRQQQNSTLKHTVYQNIKKKQKYKISIVYGRIEFNHNAFIVDDVLDSAVCYTSMTSSIYAEIHFIFCLPVSRAGIELKQCDICIERDSTQIEAV